MKLGWERDEHEHLEGRLAEEIAARKELEATPSAQRRLDTKRKGCKVCHG